MHMIISVCISSLACAGVIRILKQFSATVLYYNLTPTNEPNAISASLLKILLNEFMLLSQDQNRNQKNFVYGEKKVAYCVEYNIIIIKGQEGLVAELKCVETHRNADIQLYYKPTLSNLQTQLSIENTFKRVHAFISSSKPKPEKNLFMARKRLRIV